MPLLLALNTAEQRVQFALAETGTETAAKASAGLLVAQSWQIKSGGTELLSPALSMALIRLKRQAHEIERVAVVVGPGNFTGIRLGMVTAAGLARSCKFCGKNRQGTQEKALQAGLDYTHALAFSAHMQCRFSEETRVGVVTHARKNVVHYGFFVIREGQVVQSAPCQELSFAAPDAPNGADAAVLPLAAADILLGSGLTGNREFFDSQSFRARVLPPLFNNPLPEALLALAEQTPYSLDDPKPLYVRECDAVENLPQISRTLGHDPAKSLAEYHRLMGL